MMDIIKNMGFWEMFYDLVITGWALGIFWALKSISKKLDRIKEIENKRAEDIEKLRMEGEKRFQQREDERKRAELYKKGYKPLYSHKNLKDDEDEEEGS